MTQYVPAIVAALGVAMLYAIFKSKSKGTDIIDAIRDRKVVLQEALLVFLAVLEGLIAADVAFLHNMNYWVRLASHMAIAAISVVFGSTLYRQFQELYASIKLKQSVWIVGKELLDVLMSGLWTVLPAFANTWFIVLGRGTQVEAYTFLNFLFTGSIGKALLTIQDGTTFMSIFILIAHVSLPFYLGLFAQVNEGVSNALDNPALRQEPRPAPKPEPKPEPKLEQEPEILEEEVVEEKKKNPRWKKIFPSGK